MLEILAVVAASAAAQPIVSTQWLQDHLSDPQVRIVLVGDDGAYKQGHIPGARQMDHMDTVQMSANGHRLAAKDALVRAFTRVGVADNTHVILYGDTPMATGWVYTALSSIGHGDEVSWLDGGIALWESEKRPVETKVPAPAPARSRRSREQSRSSTRRGCAHT